MDDYTPWHNFRVEGEEIVFTIPEPKIKFNARLIKHGIKIKSDEYISWEIANQHFIRLNSINKEKRQEIYNEFRKGGISIGELAKKHNIDSMLVADLITFNIQSVSMLRSESI